MQSSRGNSTPSTATGSSASSPGQQPTWHSLSGYLHYKSSEGLSRLFRRRLWFILEDVQCRLLGFRNSESYKNKKQKPSVEIDLKTSGIFPNPVKNEEFIIICSDNEHQLEAENHESSVIWLLALQSVRNRCQGVRISTLASSMTSASSAVHSSDGGDSCPSGIKLPWKKGRSSSMLPGLHSYLSNKHSMNSALEPCKTLGISLDTGIEFYTDLSMEFNTRSDTTDSAFGSERVSRVAEWRGGNSKSSAPPSSSDDMQFNDDPFTNGTCATPSRIRQRNSSESSFELTSQHQDLLSQMMNLEKQVMNSKTMMAKLMNKECCFKEIIDQRDQVIKDLMLRIQKLENVNLKSNPDCFLKSKIESMQNQMLFQCSEIKHLTQLRHQDTQEIEHQQKSIEEITTSLGAWKDNYVYLLQSSISIPSGDSSDKWQLNLFGGDMHKKRVRELLEDARQLNPSLPDYDLLLMKMSHVDQYGFKHEFDCEDLLLHYICQQLHQHYRTLYPEHQNYLMMWNEILSGPSLLSFHAIAGMKIMCRQGIPVQYRSEVWKRLIYGRISDMKQEKGVNYFGHLMTRAYDSLLSGYYRKQIFIDLLRTMPSNVNFCDPTTEGIRKLKEVLQAFSFHNPAIGYCQGLNFVASMCLLFFDAEDAFWALIAITEKYFDSSYFDKGLTGANVDQDIFQEIFSQKLPNLYEQIQKFDLEFSTITVNWFLSLFIDVVPFETLLRIWDCFLMEGPKVLFRFALAILKKHEELLLGQCDVLGLLKYLKTSTKLLYDVDGLVKTAFEELKPFPGRQQISLRRMHFVEIVRSKRSSNSRRDITLAHRKFNREQSTEETEAGPLQYLSVVPVSYNSMWVVFTSQELSKVSVYNKNEKMLISNFQVKNQILCVCAVADIILVSTLSSQIYAYNGRNPGDLLWSCTLTGTSMSMCAKVIAHRTTFSVFAALNNGFVAFFEKIPLTTVTKITPSFLSDGPLFLPVSHCPITSILLVDPHVWMACENFIHVVHCETLNLIVKFQISKSSVDFIRTMALYDPHHWHHQPANLPSKPPNNSQKGSHQAGEQSRSNQLKAVWLSVEGSSVVQMWHASEHHCMAMYDVYKGLHVLQCKEEEYLNVNKVMSLLCLDSTLWVGTRSGFIYIFAVSFSAPHYRLLLKKLESFKQIGKLKSRSYTLPLTRSSLPENDGLKTGTGPFHYNFPQNESKSSVYDQSTYKIIVNRGRIHSSDLEMLDSVEEHLCEEEDKKDSLSARKTLKISQEANSNHQAIESIVLSKISSKDNFLDDKFLMNSCNGCLILEAKFKVSEKPVRCLTLVDSHPANLTICSCSGNYGDEESILLWKKDPKDHAWTNDTIVEPHQNVHQSSTNHRAPNPQVAKFKNAFNRRLSHLLTNISPTNSNVTSNN